ncbi:MAG TPA: hypothetical protein PKC21_06645 [Oligoflexia bacterium]|nr:hypothetical protein [Oligoflexia bacterium]HMR25014.1 hypothetical protein [Oligoflexia bacterium]
MIIYQAIFLALTILVTLISIVLFETEVGPPLARSVNNLAAILIVGNFIILLFALFREVKQKKRKPSQVLFLGLMTGLIFSTIQAMLTIGYVTFYNGMFSFGDKKPLIGKIIRKERSMISSKNGEGYHYTMSIRTDERTVKINVNAKQWNNTQLFKEYNTGMHQGALGFYYKTNF